MQKINFKNLPDTSTPLNATNLNQMQDNIESAIDTVASDIPTVVDSLDGSSTTDAPSVHATNEKFNNLYPVVLYNNTTGSNSTITLSDSTENYEYIEIFYKNNDGQFSSLKVYRPNGKKISLVSVTPSGGTTNYLKSTVLLIGTTSITVNSYLETGISASGNSAVNSNQHYVIRVIGYNSTN